jgi:hemerythrin-like domain-containing protein
VHVTAVPPRGGAAPRARSEDVVEALIDCHTRLRKITTLAGELATRFNTSTEEVADVVAKVHCYFTVALPLHEEDEERSLFPRLVAHAPELAAVIAGLRTDHDAHARHVGALLELCLVLKTAPERWLELRDALGTEARAVAEAFGVHLDAEECHLFPRVKPALQAEELSCIREEMRARRAGLP